MDISNERQMGGMKQFEFKCDTKEEAEQLQTKLNKAMEDGIFLPVTTKEGWIHKLLVKLFRWFVNKGDKVLSQTTPQMRRWNLLHLLLKDRFMHPLLKLINRFIGKHLINDFDKIPNTNWNNSVRMFYYNWLEATKDIWSQWVYNQIQSSPNSKPKEKVLKADEILKSSMELRSYKARKLILDILTTMILEDTADRFWVNDFMLRNWHTMSKFYGISEEELNKVPTHKEFPMYLSKSPKDPKFFAETVNIPIWNPEDNITNEVDKLKQEIQILKQQVQVFKTKQSINKKGDKHAKVNKTKKD